MQEVSGVNVATKTPASIVCTATDIQYGIMPFMTEIIRVVETTINQLEPEISSDVARNGIYLAGGISKIPGIEKYTSFILFEFSQIISMSVSLFFN